MARLEITLQGDNIQAEAVVTVARGHLKLLRAVQKKLMTEKGLRWKDRDPWYMDITTTSQCVHIMLRGPDQKMTWGADTLEEMATVLKKAMSVSGAAEVGDEAQEEVR
jgi:hypothetical protein